MVVRRKGFTLIELLVVIAIIGILAAMLFPVFARARESARKTQCLSNVKNIAMAIQMYLADYDSFPPSEHRQDAMQAFTDWISSDRGCDGSSKGYRATWGNPFLRWPVILDDYIKNREVWHCPSSRWDPSAWWIVPSYGGDWLKYLADTHGQWTMNGWSPGGSACAWAFPPGWGGDVTDSIAQQAGTASPTTNQGAFSGTIGCASTMLTDKPMSSINDPANCVVCGDGTQFGAILQGSNSLLYEACKLGCGADWANCPSTKACSISQEMAQRWATDATLRKQYTRHMGGSNIGFADGHAKWWAADAVVAKAPYCDNGAGVTTDKDGQLLLEGLCP